MYKSIKILYWTPRIITILGILFVSIFALDAFNGNDSIWHKLGSFGIHLIPSFVLAILLLFAWKWEKVGGLIFIFLGVFFSYYLFVGNYKSNHSFWVSFGIIASICFPFIIAGILFAISADRKAAVKYKKSVE